MFYPKDRGNTKEIEDRPISFKEIYTRVQEHNKNKGIGLCRICLYLLLLLRNASFPVMGSAYSYLWHSRRKSCFHCSLQKSEFPAWTMDRIGSPSSWGSYKSIYIGRLYLDSFKCKYNLGWFHIN